MLIMRGWPGSGKSFLAKQIQTYNEKCFIKTEIFSTDNYWMLKDGTYRFDATKLGVAHGWNQTKVDEALSRYGFAVPDCIIIDNTNLTFKELIPYLDIAKSYKVSAFEVVPNTPWMYNTQECVDRNQHCVPFEAIERMMKKFEPSLQTRITEYMCNNYSMYAVMKIVCV